MTIRLGLSVVAAVVGVAACSGPSAPAAPPTTPTTSQRAATATDAAFEMRLTSLLQPPALPSFTIPTDLLDSPEDRDIARRLKLQPGLYRGIAVLSERCDKGIRHSADASTVSAPGSGNYDKGNIHVTVKRDGTGVYNAPGIHVAVLAGGSGVFQQGSLRLSIEPDGSGTWVDGSARLSVSADRSGSYSDPKVRFWIGSDGSGGYSDDRVRVSVASSGSVTGTASPPEQAVVARLVKERFQPFPPVPAIRRVRSTGVVCGTIIRMDSNALFNFGSAELRPDALDLVNRVAGLLRVVRPKTIEINGYTDHIGTSDDNLRLSRQRAGAVASDLSAHGVSAGSIRVHGLGEADPIRPETTPSGADDPGARQLNRRVEILVSR